MTSNSNTSNEALSTTGVGIGIVVGCLVIILILSAVLVYRKHKNTPEMSMDSPQLSIHKIYGSDGFGTCVAKDDYIPECISYESVGDQFSDGPKLHDSRKVICEDEDVYLT